MSPAYMSQEEEGGVRWATSVLALILVQTFSCSWTYIYSAFLSLPPLLSCSKCMWQWAPALPERRNVHQQRAVPVPSSLHWHFMWEAEVRKGSRRLQPKLRPGGNISRSPITADCPTRSNWALHMLGSVWLMASYSDCFKRMCHMKTKHNPSVRYWNLKKENKKITTSKLGRPNWTKPY